jgi:hypothetical protein
VQNGYPEKWLRSRAVFKGDVFGFEVEVEDSENIRFILRTSSIDPCTLFARPISTAELVKASQNGSLGGGEVPY